MRAEKISTFRTIRRCKLRRKNGGMSASDHNQNILRQMASFRRQHVLEEKVRLQIYFYYIKSTERIINKGGSCDP